MFIACICFYLVAPLGSDMFQTLHRAPYGAPVAFGI